MAARQMRDYTTVEILASIRRDGSVFNMNMARILPRRNARLVVIVSFAALLCGASPAFATPFLGSAATFAVLGASAVTNTGATSINGDLGIFPGTTITGLGTITITGTVYKGGP